MAIQTGFNFSLDHGFLSTLKRRPGEYWLAVICASLLTVPFTGCGSYSKKMTYMQPPNSPSPSKSLWVANGTNVLEFSSTQLTTSGISATAPTLVLNSSVFAVPQDLVFDASGNLWVLDGGVTTSGVASRPALYEFTSASLSGQPSPVTAMPSITMTSSAFKFPRQAAFDAKGDLWVSDSGNNAVMEFTQAQIMAGGADLAPAIYFQSQPAFNSGFGGTYNSALGIAFDSGGNLWVANNGGNTIFEFNAADLIPNLTAHVPYLLTPQVVLSDPTNNPAIQGPWGLAFDSSGNLWVSNVGYWGEINNLVLQVNTVVEFPKSSLAATGTPSPAVILRSATVGTNTSLNFPKGIAFDASGNLSVVSSGAPFPQGIGANSADLYGIDVYSSSQIRSGGAIAPNAFITGATTMLNAPTGSAFGPTISYGNSGSGGSMY